MEAHPLLRGVHELFYPLLELGRLPQLTDETEVARRPVDMRRDRIAIIVSCSSCSYSASSRS